MDNKHTISRSAAVFIIAGFAAVLISASARAESPGEKKLSDEGAKVETLANSNPGNHAKTLADQFEVPIETVEGLRETGGWGEASIQLSLAKKLSETDPEQYPTTGDALPVIRDLRTDGLGYGQIAKQNGFKLGHVIRETKRARKSVQTHIRKAGNPSKAPYGPPGIMKKSGAAPAGNPGKAAGRPDHAGPKNRPK